MDRVEAKWILLRKLAEYQRKPYAALCTMIDDEHHVEVEGSTGARYQLEIQIFWDSQPEGDLRILASIDDGGWRAWYPLSYGTLVSRPG